MAKEKVVLAYSGGLDTSVIMKWLTEKYDYFFSGRRWDPLFFFSMTDPQNLKYRNGL